MIMCGCSRTSICSYCYHNKQQGIAGRGVYIPRAPGEKSKIGKMRKTHISGRGTGAVFGDFSLIKSFYAQWLAGIQPEGCAIII